MLRGAELQLKGREIFLLLLFGGVSFALMLCHEPWRDELQAWLVARDLTLMQVLAELRNEGHFLLWYLVLKPFAAMKEVALLGEISWLLSLGGALVLTVFSPFQFRTKAAVLLSAPFLYWYTALSRCYALIPVLLFWAAAVWKQRFRHPVKSLIPVMLLANTHVIMEGFVFGVFLVRLTETLKRRKQEPELFRKNVLALGLLVLSVLAAFFQVWPCRSNVPRSNFASILTDFLPVHASILTNYCRDACQLPLRDYRPAAAALLFLCVTAFFCFRDALKEDKRKWPVIVSLLAGLAVFPLLIFSRDRHPDVQLLNGVSHSLFAAVFLVALIRLFRSGKKEGWIFLSGCLMLYGITAALYPYVIAQRAMLFFFLYVFCVWIIREERPDSGASAERMILFLSLMLLPGLIFSMHAEFTKRYSMISTTAAFISRNVPKDAYIAFWPHDDTTSVLSAFAPEHCFHSLATGRPETFFRHTGQPVSHVPDQQIREQFRDREGYLILPVFSIGCLMEEYRLEERLRGEYVFSAVHVPPSEPVIAQEQFAVFKVTKVP